MLTPSRLSELPESMVALIDDLQMSIIEDISKRLVKADYLTPTAEWMLYKANQLKLSSKEVTKLIAETAGKRERELRAIYNDAVKEAINNDAKIYRDVGKNASSYFRSVSFSDFLVAGLSNTKGMMNNLTRSLAISADGTLTRLLDKAYLQVGSGAFTLQEAVRNTVVDLAGQGIQKIAYPSGRFDWADVAVRRAVTTGISQTVGKMSLDLADEMGCDLVEVTSHLGARPSHAEWQGKIYSISGTSTKYPSLYQKTGYGTGAGLKGWNCKHDFYPFFEGASTQVHFPKNKQDNDEYYENLQRQRAMERGVRESKRKCLTYDTAIKSTEDADLKAKLQPKFDRSASTLKKREARLNEFCKEKNLLVRTDRAQVHGFNKSVSQKAVAGNKRYLSKVDSGNKGGIINYAKSNEIFEYQDSRINNVHPQDITDLLEQSDLGKETLSQLSKMGIKPTLNYYKAPHTNRGSQSGKAINIYMNNISNAKVAAQTVIHETTHAYYGIGHSQWAEAVCFAKEKIFLTGRPLTVSEKRYIVKLARDSYPEFKWKRGGSNYGIRY